jgi:large subunit ribosomal protein L25
MSASYELNVTIREPAGTGASRRLRRSGQVPGVMYGAGKDNTHIVMDHEDVMHKLEIEAFQSAIIDVKVDGKSQQAILRDVQMHPYRRQVMHIDFQRIRATEKFDISVPIHYTGEEEAPGLKIEGGIFSRLMNDVQINCLPADLPEYLEVDVSALDMSASVHLSDIQLPDGVTITSLAHEGEDLAIATIMPPKIEEEEEEVEAEAEDLEGAEEGDTDAEAPTEDAE